MTPLPSNQRQQPRGERRLKRPTKVTRARWAAWLTLRRTFDENAWTDRAFTAIVEQLGLDDDPRERAFAQRLAYGAVQQAKRIDYVIGVLGKRPLNKIDPPVLHALRLGVHELLDLQQSTGPDGEVLGSSSAHAAVSQAVELVRGVVGERAVAFTNAILRRAQVDGAQILSKLDVAEDADAAIVLSMPEWLVTRVRAAHGQRGIDALQAQNAPRAVSAFRVNAAHPDVVAGWDPADHGLAPAALPGGVVHQGSTAAFTDDVDEGRLVPQSLASQLVTLALDPQPGDRVLDMCAAPGGKTTHIASRLGGRGEVVAVELHEHRADSIRHLAARTHTRGLVRVRVEDATRLDAADVGMFDRILVDAPCTGTGVLASRPDARWKRRDEGVEELAALQRSLLQAAVRLIRPGGVIVYSTCSILREEDEDIVADLTGLTPLDLPDAVSAATGSTGHMARTWPGETFAEGFFIARYERSAVAP